MTLKLLIVDDSATEMKILQTIFTEPDFKIVGWAKNGEEAIKLTAQLKPDVITMDVQMPVMDGYDATRIIMSQNPTPIIVISSNANNAALNMTFKALEAGALSVLPKPSSIFSADFEKEKKRIVNIVRSMAEIKVITRRFNTKTSKRAETETKLLLAAKNKNYKLVAIGTSVGGPAALKSILCHLDEHFPLPIVIVQHMTPGFINGFIDWLGNYCKLKIKIAVDNEYIKKGTIYFAPDQVHLEIQSNGNDLITHLKKSPPVSGFCPSITELFHSVSKVCGENAIGVLLTGMGSDGAQGLLEMKQARAHTVIQDADSAVVFGMAGVAQALGAVDKVVALENIAQYLSEITAQS